MTVFEGSFLGSLYLWSTYEKSVVSVWMKPISPSNDQQLHPVHLFPANVVISFFLTAEWNSSVRVWHLLFSDFSVDRHLGLLHALVFVNVVTEHVKVLLSILSPLGTDTAVEQLDHMAVLILGFLETSMLASTVTRPGYTPTNSK